MKTIYTEVRFKRLLPLLLAAAIVVLPACSGTPKPAPTATPPVAISEGSFADGRGVELSFKLLYALEGTGVENSVLGTAGIIEALVAVKSGSANETDTALANVLGMQGLLPKDISDSALRLRQAVEKLTTGKFATAWGLFVGNGQAVKESFLSDSKQSLRLETLFQPLDGDAGIKYLNEWTDESTGGILKRVDFTLPAAQTPFFVDLFSADPDWQRALDTGKSRPLPFVYEDGEDKAVPTMVCMQYCGIYQGAEGAVAVLPGADDQTRLVVYVPPEKTSLRDFIPVAAARHDEWLEKAEWKTQRVLLPRFALQYEGSVMGILTGAGIGPLLAKEQDYSALGEGLYFSDILQKAVFNMDESGVDSPDPTAVYRQGMKDDVMTLAVNRPFIVSLEKTDSDQTTGTLQVLAMGYVRDPLNAKLK